MQRAKSTVRQRVRAQTFTARSFTARKYSESVENVKGARLPLADRRLYSDLMSSTSLVLTLFERRFEVDFQRRTSSSCS